MLTFFEAGPTAASVVKIIFAVEGAIRESVSIDFREPKIPLHKITCYAGIEGNVGVYLSVTDAVASEGTMTNTRSEVPTTEATYKILGNQADMTIVEFEERVAGIQGVV